MRNEVSLTQAIRVSVNLQRITRVPLHPVRMFLVPRHMLKQVPADYHILWRERKRRRECDDDVVGKCQRRFGWGRFAVYGGEDDMLLEGRDVADE